MAYNEQTIFVAGEYKHVRCPHCKRLLAKVSGDTSGRLYFKCTRCKKEVTVHLQGSQPSAIELMRDAVL